MKLILDKAWPGPRGMMPAGEYAIPSQISMSHARCAVADDAGQLAADATQEEGGSAAPAATMFPPETKEHPSEQPPTRTITTETSPAAAKRPAKRGSRPSS